VTAAKDMTREDLLVRLAEVIVERDATARDLDRERIHTEDLQREMAGLRMFRLRVGELTHSDGRASDDMMINTIKVWLAFYRQVAALCPRASIPGTMLDWIRMIKGKAAEYDRSVH